MSRCEGPPSADSSRVFAVLNKRSGASGKQSVAERVADFFATRGRHVEVAVAGTGAELRSAVAHAAASDAGVIIAGGGDGTISALASAILGSGKVLAVLPLGTFNFFARRFNVPLDLDAALEVVVSGRPTRADVGDVNGHVFLNNSSIGLYPAVLQRREATYRMIGRSQAAAYASVALAMLRPPALLNLRLELDGTQVTRRTPLLFVGTNEYQMESFGIPGHECVREGRLAAYITRPLTLAPLWRFALRAFFRGLHGARELEVQCARQARVSLRPRRVRVALDGELKVLETPLHFRMRVGELTVMAGLPSETTR
jgi:diacylglycerol kinase family enzyme